MYQQILLQDHMANQSKCYPSAHQCTSISVQSDVIYQNSLIEDVNTWLMRCIPALFSGDAKMKNCVINSHFQRNTELKTQLHMLYFF